MAYVPVLHAGYLQLFEKHPEALIYVLGQDVIARFDELRKDLRALKPQESVDALSGWGKRAEVLNARGLKRLSESGQPVIMPDEDISHELAAHELAKTPVTFETIFLRWDRRKMQAVNDPVIPDSTVSVDRVDQELIQQAAALGAKSSNLWRRMGAIVTRDGNLIAQGHNSSYPTAHTSWIEGDPRNNAHRGDSIDLTLDIHAEARLISNAAREGVSLKGASMYIVDFPCPTCAKLIANSGISRLFYAKGYAVLDGQQALRAASVEVIRVEGVEIIDPAPDVWVPYPEKN